VRVDRRKVLVVDDEESMVTVIRYALEEAGFAVASAPDTARACELFDDFAPDLVVLDVMLEGGDSGLDLCRDLRARSRVPIVMLSARSEELDRILGLELGADDYVTKPFSPRELVSRVKAHLRRAGELAEPGEDGVVTLGDLRIDLEGHEVSVAGVEKHLTPTEFRILALLAAHPGKLHAREAILNHLWNGGFIGDARAVDVHVHNIREKIEPDPSSPSRLITVRGEGYRLKAQ
jgi:DNA-binding response OmpR family regulator